MKKALIALSIAGVIGAAQAENTTTLYGALGFETAVAKNSGEDVDDAIKKTRWDLNTESAKLGIKGTEDLGEDLQAFYKLEFKFGNNSGLNKTKYAYLGLKGSFGTITFGKQDSLYKKVTNYNDIFENSWFGVYNSFNGYYFGSAIPKAISYVSPDLSGLQFGIAGVLDGSNEVELGDAEIKSDRKSFTALQAGIWYDQAGFFAGLGYAITHGDEEGPKGKVKLIGGSLGYSNDTFRVGLGAEHASGDGQVYNLAGEYYFGPNTLRAGFSIYDPKDKETKNVYGYALGYQYNFSKRTYTYVEGEYFDLNDKDTKNGYTVRVGIHHDF